MKAVILAGGLGIRWTEETHLRPKPMVEIGGKPIHWYILKTYSHYGINEFIICCGSKGCLIKEYFPNLIQRFKLYNRKNTKLKFSRFQIKLKTILGNPQSFKKHA
jgi:glucose-1-phosphate cytidylyltransferase